MLCLVSELFIFSTQTPCIYFLIVSCVAQLVFQAHCYYNFTKPSNPLMNVADKKVALLIGVWCVWAENSAEFLLIVSPAILKLIFYVEPKYGGTYLILNPVKTSTCWISPKHFVLNRFWINIYKTNHLIFKINLSWRKTCCLSALWCGTMSQYAEDLLKRSVCYRNEFRKC